jgi:uncharacterized protein
MTNTPRVAGAAVSFLLVASLVGGDPRPAPQLILRATYDTGFGQNGAEIISVRDSDDLAVLTNVAGFVDVLDLSNPLQPFRLRRVPIDASSGSPNSAAIHPHHDYFLVVTGTAGATGAVGAYRLSDGLLLDMQPVGIQPDSIAIAPNGQYAVIANEAEGVATGNDGGPGSVSVVDLRGFNGVNTREFNVLTFLLSSIAGTPGLSSQRTDDLARLLIDHTPNRIEPESVAFSHDSRFAFVTLQENNGVIRIDFHRSEMTVFGLGTVDHLADLTVDGNYSATERLTAFREPDGIALDQTGRFFVTADEGDTRNAAGAGAVRGGRTLSVFDAQSGAFIADTGNQLDDVANAAGLYPDSRSNRGGSEPEVLDMTHDRGITLVAIALERANAVALVDLSDPANPTVGDIAGVGTGPEGIKFFRVGSRLFVASANEVAGTVSILEVVY